MISNCKVLNRKYSVTAKTEPSKIIPIKTMKTMATGLPNLDFESS
jgi:hypothetical protein